MSLSLPAKLFSLQPDAEVEMGLRCENGPVVLPQIVTVDADNVVSAIVPGCGAAKIGVWIYAPSNSERVLHWYGFSDVELIAGQSVEVTIVAEKAGEALFAVDGEACTLQAPEVQAGVELRPDAPLRLPLQVGMYTASCGDESIMFEIGQAKVTRVQFGRRRQGVGFERMPDGPFTVAEGGSTPIALRLTAPPVAPVRINAVSSLADVTVMPASLEFTRDNWDVPQTFAVNAAQDTLLDPDQQGVLSFGVESLDGAYAALALLSQNFTVIDDEIAPPAFAAVTNPPSPSQLLAFSVVGTSNFDASVAVWVDDPNCAGAPFATVQATPAGAWSVSGFSVALDGMAQIYGMENGGACVLLTQFVHDDDPPNLELAMANPSASNLPFAMIGASTEPFARLEVYSDSLCEGAVLASAAALGTGAVVVQVPVPAAAFNSTMTFHVRARDAAGNGSIGCLPVVFEHDDLPPEMGLSISSETTPPTNGTQMMFSGFVMTENTFVYLYRVPGCVGTPAVISGPHFTGWNVIDTELPRNQSTTYSFAAADAAGNTLCAMQTVTVQQDDILPTAPAITMATAVSGGIEVSWSASTDANLAGYEVDTCSPSPCEPTFSGGVFVGSAMTNTVIGGLANCGSFSVAVRARDAANNLSARARQNGLAPTTGTPPAPTVVAVPGGVDITFAAVSGSNVNYEVCRSESAFACASGDVIPIGVSPWARIDIRSPRDRFWGVRAIDNGCLGVASTDIQQNPLELTATVIGSPTGTGFSKSITVLGDVDGDAFPDFAVGAPDKTLGDGAVTVFSGRSGRIIRQLNAAVSSGGRFGDSVAGVHDIDGDGLDELLVGAPLFAGQGRAFLYGGPALTLRATYTCDSACTGSGFGSAVADAGDTDNDGIHEVAIGGPNHGGNTGAVWVFHALDDTAPFAFQAGAPSSRFGSSLVSIPDAGIGAAGDELVIGAPNETTGDGAVYVFGLDVAPALLMGAGSLAGVTDGQCGTSLANVGDTNGDGITDVAVGCPGANSGDGLVLIRTGDTNFANLHALNVEQGGSVEGFGTAVSAAGDLDQDGRMDLFIGSPNLGFGAVIARKASGGFLYEVRGDATHTQLGKSLAGGADFDGDGVGDVLGGSPEGGNPGSVWQLSAHQGQNLGAMRTRHAEFISPAGPVGFSGRHTPGALPSGPLFDLGLLSGLPTFSFHVWASPSGSSVSNAGVWTPGAGIGGYDTVRMQDSLLRTFETRLLVHHHPTVASLQVNGAAAGQFLGENLILLGDVTGDGVADFVTGSGRADGNNGAFARVNGLTGSVIGAVINGAGTERLGATLANVGDVTGDGINDFAVGSPSANVGGGVIGSVTVYSGADGTVAVAAFSGTAEDDGFGAALANVGDQDGDGFAELAVGAPNADEVPTTLNCGKVHIIKLLPFSFLGTAMRGFVSGGSFGAAIASGSDFTDDARFDIVIGSPNENTGNGAVRVFDMLSRTQVGGTLSGAGGEGFGGSVAAGGDVDGDHVHDFAVGAPNGGVNAGSVRVFNGQTRSVIISVNGPPGGGAGKAVEIVGDVDGDRLADVAVGSPNASIGGGTNNGQVSIVGYSGNPTTPKSIYSFSGAVDANPKRFGSAIARTGDLNGDGLADLAFGIAENDVGFTDSGSFAIHKSSTPPTLARPLNFRESGSASLNLGVEWDDVPAAVAYELRFRPVGGVWDSVIAVSGQTSRSIGVPVDGWYEIHMRAFYNGEGESLPSQTLFIQLSPP